MGVVNDIQTVLGIEVDGELFERWVGWFAPDPQPFIVPAVHALARIGNSLPSRLADAETRDTFEVYGLAGGTVCRAVTFEEFMSLSRSMRAELVRTQYLLGRALVPSVRSWPAMRVAGTAEQADGHRFVWWRKLLEGHEERVLTAFIEDGRRPSRQAEVTEEVWRVASDRLPGARELAGKFPSGSGPNCFGTIMAAAGVVGTADVWMQRDPFEAWLCDSTRPGGRDEEPGTILLWRSSSGRAEHAALTLGGGWSMHKPSQGWMSPVKVLANNDTVRSARAHGRHLVRRRLT